MSFLSLSIPFTHRQHLDRDQIWTSPHERTTQRDKLAIKDMKNYFAVILRSPLKLI